MQASKYTCSECKNDVKLYNSDPQGLVVSCGCNTRVIETVTEPSDEWGIQNGIIPEESE